MNGAKLLGFNQRDRGGLRSRVLTVDALVQSCAHSRLLSGFVLVWSELRSVQDGNHEEILSLSIRRPFSL